MAQNRPLVLPETFTGEKSWEEWSDHFESVAAVNDWDAAAKLKWLRVRLTGRAATTFRRLPEATRGDFALATAALCKRFEPESKKELYMAELQTRTKRRKEDWVVFGEELKRLADKGYPELQEEARERLALNQYLTGLENPQVAFSVRQNKPETVDDAVRITLEMESYLQASKTTIEVASVVDKEEEPGAIANTTQTKPNDPLQLLLDRMDKLEKAVQQKPPEPGGRANARWRPSRSTPPSGQNFRRPPRTCWNCQGEGHISSNCPSPRRENQEPQKQPPPMRQPEHQRPGNERPSEL